MLGYINGVFKVVFKGFFGYELVEFIFFLLFYININTNNYFKDRYILKIYIFLVMDYFSVYIYFKNPLKLRNGVYLDVLFLLVNLLINYRIY